MNDTPRELSELLVERYRGRTPGERVRMVMEMFRAATALARAGIREQDADADESTVRGRLLRRLYEGALTEWQLLHIIRSWEVARR